MPVYTYMGKIFDWNYWFVILSELQILKGIVQALEGIEFCDAEQELSFDGEVRALAPINCYRIV